MAENYSSLKWKIFLISPMLTGTFLFLRWDASYVGIIKEEGAHLKNLKTVDLEHVEQQTLFRILLTYYVLSNCQINSLF